MRRISVLALCATLFSFGLTGCGGGSGENQNIMEGTDDQALVDYDKMMEEEEANMEGDGEEALNEE